MPRSVADSGRRRQAPGCPILPTMLLADLTDFVTRHRPCGQLTGDASEPDASGYVVTMSCECGAVFTRVVTLEDATSSRAIS